MIGGIHFYLKKPERVSGRSMIIMQWKYNKLKLVVSTKESIANRDEWDFEKERVKLNPVINHLLNRIESFLYLNIKLKGNIPIPVVLKKSLKLFIQSIRDKRIQKAKEEIVTKIFKPYKQRPSQAAYSSLWYQQNKQRHHEMVNNYRRRKALEKRNPDLAYEHDIYF